MEQENDYWLFFDNNYKKRCQNGILNLYFSNGNKFDGYLHIGFFD